MSASQGKSSCSRVKDKALIIDSFGKPFTFLLPDGQKMYRSLLGAILTVFIILTVSFYAIYKWQLLIDKDEARITLTIDEGHYNENNSTITRENDKFNIAVGIASSVFLTTLVEDKSYGELSVTQKSWDLADENTIESEPVTLRKCNSRDIPLEGEDVDAEDARFFPIENSQSVNITLLRDQLNCFDQDVEMYGDYDQRLKSIINVKFESCRSSTESAIICKSDEQVKKWLSDKYLVILQNEQSFVTQDYSNPMKSSSSFQRYKISPIGKFEYNKKVTKFNLNLSDSLLSIGLLL